MGYFVAFHSSKACPSFGFDISAIFFHFSRPCFRGRPSFRPVDLPLPSSWWGHASFPIVRLLRPCRHTRPMGTGSDSPDLHQRGYVHGSFSYFFPFFPFHSVPIHFTVSRFFIQIVALGHTTAPWRQHWFSVQSVVVLGGITVFVIFNWSQRS